MSEANGHDVLIAGGGPAGSALALALAQAGLRVAIADPRDERGQPPPARLALRPIALSYASRLILERIGVWTSLDTTAIETISVSQQGGFGRTVLAAHDAGLPALGYVIDYASLDQALRTAVRARDVAYYRGSVLGAADTSSDSVSVRVSDERGSMQVSARCLVHAEGTPADDDGKRYQQDALVTLVESDPPAHATAFERFTSEGPLALLPYAGRFAVVWALRPERARMLVACDPDEFLCALAAAAGPAIGVPRTVAGRISQPLLLRVRAARAGARQAYIANAAQTLHPVAGQGLNLGLRDAWGLARILRDADDPGAPGVLRRFSAERAMDTHATVRITDLLAGAFIETNRVSRTVLGAAMTALDVAPPLRRFFARRMVFGPSAIP